MMNHPHLSVCPHLSQFHLDLEPQLQPSVVGVGAAVGGANDSQDVSFSHTPKGTQHLQDSESELNLVTRTVSPSCLIV